MKCVSPLMIISADAMEEYILHDHSTRSKRVFPMIVEYFYFFIHVVASLF